MNKKDSAIIRKREAEVAQRLSPSWNGQDPKPVLSPEVITYEVSEKTGAVSYGGLGLLQQVVKWSGLGKAIDRAVKLLKRHQPYHESDHVLSLIYNVATGGTRYQDIEMRRQSVSFLEAVGAEKIPAPSTAGDRRGWDDCPHDRRMQGRDGDQLRRAVGLCATDRDAGEYGRSALCRQPIGQPSLS